MPANLTRSTDMLVSPGVIRDPCSIVSRRSFLQVVAGSALGWTYASPIGLAKSMTSESQLPRRSAQQIILIFLAGGPSQIDTWDPKPSAPVEFRNIDPSCATSVPGVWISQNLPGMAKRMHQVALVRSLSHDGPATHSAGLQLLMTGQCFYHHETAPDIGSVLSRLLGGTGDLPANVVLGGRLAQDFAAGGDGQTTTWLGPQHAPHFADLSSTANRSSVFDQSLDVQRETWQVQRQYGFHDLGRMCLQARRLVEHGVRIVTVNQFRSVLDQTTWDMHANGGRLNSTAADYRDTLCPQLDQALCGLLDDLSDRGLLAETVVAVCGEMGRSPVINRYGGRDHHTGAWSALLAGGPILPGVVVGSTDAFGANPETRPVTPAELSATLYHSLGIDAARTLGSGLTGTPWAVSAVEPINELF